MKYKKKEKSKKNIRKILYYINQKDELILVDFKTDYIGTTPEAKQKVLEKYKVQLEIYQKALEQALGKKVSKAQLCLANSNWETIDLID